MPTRRGVLPDRPRGVMVASAAAAVCAALALTPTAAAPRPIARAAQTECASLGEAANYAVFSNGVFNSSQASGTSISGRIGAAGNVTLDAISVNPAAGDLLPTVVTAGDFTGGGGSGGGGSGGSLTGGIRVQGTIDIAQNFTVDAQEQGPPGFSFADEFTALRSLSSQLGDLPQTDGASVLLSFGALTLEGTAAGTNVFTVTASDLLSAQGIVINLTQPNATALINVTTDTDLQIAPQYMTLSGSATPARIAWNFPLATSLAVTHGVAWPGLILAPNASVTGLNGPQLAGQLVARTVPDSRWVITRTTFTGCLPVTPVPPNPTPDDTLALKALCVDGQGLLDMRLTNKGEQARTVRWRDLGGDDFGAFVAGPGRHVFFEVHRATAASVIEVTAGTTTITEPATSHQCRGTITVQKSPTARRPRARAGPSASTTARTALLAGRDASAPRSRRRSRSPAATSRGPPPSGKSSAAPRTRSPRRTRSAPTRLPSASTR